MIVQVPAFAFLYNQCDGYSEYPMISFIFKVIKLAIYMIKNYKAQLE